MKWLSEALGFLRLLSVMGMVFAGEVLAGDYPVRPVPFTDVSLTGGVWKSRQETNTRVTLPFAIEQCESSNRVRNFDLAAETMRRRAAGEKTFQNKPATGFPFDDSDVYKVLEGAAYCLSVQPDPAMAAKVESIIRRIAAAQEPDGYLYTFRTMHPDSPAHPWINQKRWLNDWDLSHELYNIGHLYEAGTAHVQATGSRSLLDVCLKNAELLQRDFGDGKLRIAPGHEVIEMGLVKLYRQSGEKRWLDLAKFFLDARGYGNRPYSQDHKPVVEQSEAVGHAVRANYLYSGMADVAALAGDERYHEAITRIWENVVGRKLYLTGGCGAKWGDEAYGKDYELPHSGYNETCAAIAFLFWNHRMFLMSGDGKYMDVFERTLYNGFLSGVSISGDRFFYSNPLEYDGKSLNNHGHAGRAPWFGCACCPPNVLRTLASLGGYVYAVRDDRLYVNLYAQGKGRALVNGVKVDIAQETSYPWDGRIKFDIKPEKPATFTVALRLPGWARGYPLPSDLYAYEDATPGGWSVMVNGEPVSVEPVEGYVRLERNWNAGDSVVLDLPMPVRRVVGNAKIAATRNQLAMERGPVVYCFEGVDNEGGILNAFLPALAKAKAVYRPDLMGGATVLEVSGAGQVVRNEKGTLLEKACVLTAVPYAYWNNRGLSPMKVWLPREASGARPAVRPTVASNAKVSVSFCRGGMDPAMINDQLMPQNATDSFARDFDFWPHKGTQEWVQYNFAKPAEVKKIRVWWFDDTGSGECRLPKSWRVVYRTAEGKWEPVTGVKEHSIVKGTSVEVSFTPITTMSLRLEIQLAEGFSAGLYEWGVE